MILILAILALIVFGGLGFVAHLLWIGLIIAAILFVVHFVMAGRTRRVP